MKAAFVSWHDVAAYLEPRNLLLLVMLINLVNYLDLANLI